MEDAKLWGKTGKKWPKWQKPGRDGLNIVSVSFRQLQSASADVRGRPRHVWTEDGRWKMGNYEEKYDASAIS